MVITYSMKNFAVFFFSNTKSAQIVTATIRIENTSQATMSSEANRTC